MCLFFHREDARPTHIFQVGDRVLSTSTCCLRKGTPHPLKNQRTRTFKIRVHPGFSAPHSEPGASVDDCGTCNLACSADGGEKQQETHREAHRLPKISVLGDLIGPSIFN